SFAIKAWPVSRLVTRLQPAGKSFTVAERYLSTDNSFLIKRNRNRRVWLEATAENLPPGTYSSLVTVSSAKSILKIPIHLKVLNWALPAVDFPVGPFNSTIQESWWFAGENNFREEKLLQQSFKMMNSVGLTTASFNAKFEVNWDKKPLIIKGLDRVNHLMNLAKQNHFKSLVAYNAVFSNQDLCFGSFSNADLELWVEALKQQSKLKQWLPLQIIVCDEPVGSEDLKKAVSRVETLQKFSDDHLQFGAAFSFNSQHQESKELYSKSQLPFLNLFDMDKLKSDQKNWIYYNAADRSSFGFGLFRLRQQTALQARIAWNWNQNAGNPYFALDAREDDINWCNSLKDGQLQCSVFLKRHILEGLNDYRLALLLKTLKSEKAKIIVKDIELHASISKDPIPGDFDNKYQQEEAWRNQILSLLESMSDEMSVKAKSK
ncbi:MAG: hypothetical protein H7061_04705, partial [Bdellovibrionaceae bacterium]|nr:hypothetical protein [Bdellovibrio sp.]